MKKNHFWLWGSTCFLLALVAMKSKEIAFTLPLMIVLLEITLFRGQFLKNRLFLALGTSLLLIIPVQLIYRNGARSVDNLYHTLQSASAETSLIPRVDYLLTQFRVVATYVRLLILPINQNLDYDYPLYHRLFDAPVFASLLLHVSLLLLALVLFVRSKQLLVSGTVSAGISMRLMSLGIFWFYLALSVESTLIPIRDVIFEHRVYLPSVGFFIAATSCIAGFLTYKPRYRTIVWSALALICIIFTVSTYARNRKWSSEMVMWQDVLEKSPNKARVRHAVGLLYYRKYQPEKALPYLVRALELDARSEKYWVTLNDAIVITEKYKGRGSYGAHYYSSTESVNPAYRKQWWAISFNNLGLAYEHMGNMYLARENYLKAVNSDESLDLAWYNLAMVAAYQNDVATVAASLKKLEAINPKLERDAAREIQEQQRTK